MSALARLVLFAPLCAGLGGCGTDEETPPPSAARTPRATAGDRLPRILYRAPGEVATPGIQSAIDRQAPSAANWRSEELYDLARLELAGLFDRVAGGAPVRDLSGWLAPVFAGSTRLVPAELRTVYDDGALLVRRERTLDDDPRPAADVERLFDELLAAFAPASSTAGRDADAGLRARSKVFTTELDPRYPRRFTTRTLVLLDGPALGGGRLQVDQEWTVGWELLERDHGELARIRSIRLERHTEARSVAPLMAELTEHVFGDLPRWEEEFLIGSGEYHFRTDTLNGNVFAGQIGVAVGDVDGDGLEDVYVPQHGGLPNRLLLHRPDGTVVDASEESGLALLDDTQSALFVDLDADGDQDAVLATGNVLLVAENDGHGVFTFLPRPLAVPGHTGQIKSLTAADWDVDGDLDLYACVYSEKGPLGAIPVPYHDALNGPPNLAWRNDGRDGWTEVAAALGLDANNTKFSYAAVWDDLDGDDDLDLYVVNDFGRNNLYRNDGGHFTDVALAAGADDLAAGMGVSAEDVDGDGDVDLYVTNMWSSAGRRIVPQQADFQGGDASLQADYLRHARGNTLLLNDGHGTFEDVTTESGAMNAGWAWGALLVDLNSDGLPDAYSPNGFLTGPRDDDL